MSEKRIKGTVISGPMNVRFVTADDELPPDGTEVEIVYREEVEIRPGQRWRSLLWSKDYRVVSVFNKWALIDDEFCPLYVDVNEGGHSKAQLQAWLNEHATLAEGES